MGDGKKENLAGKRILGEKKIYRRILILLIVGDGGTPPVSRWAGEPVRDRSGHRSGTIIRAARIIDGNRFRWYAKSGN